MYYVIVIGSMVVLPGLSIAVEVLAYASAFDAALIAKWFVFWGVGWRLFLAGTKQILQPRYTANLLGLMSDESSILIRELGFANAAMGTAGILSLFAPGWRIAIALVGGLFYLLAGINHALQPRGNARQMLAMASDLLMALVLLGACIASATMR